MNRLNKLLLAFTLLGSSLAAHADDTSNFAGLTFGQTSDKVKKSHALNDNLGHPDASGAIDGNNTYGVRLGQQNSQGRYYATYDNVSGSHNGIKLRQEICWAVTICSIQWAAAPSCSAAPRPV